MDFFVNNEYNKLNSVILGIAHDFGGIPKISDVYDPHSRLNVINGTFPNQQAIINEIDYFQSILIKHGVNVLTPKNIPGTNQIFTRDIGFVIEEYFFVSNVIKERNKEYSAIQHIVSNFNKDNIISLSDDINIEGGDVILFGDKLFIGYSKDDDFKKFKVARTNINGVNFLKNFFKEKEIIPIELIKSDTSITKNCLHLDCCLQPLGLGHLVFCPGALINKKDIDTIKSIFKSNIIEISFEEMQKLYSNFFSISQKTVVSDRRFDRLNHILVKNGYNVEEVNYEQISRMGGLLRCSTLPLNRSI